MHQQEALVKQVIASVQDFLRRSLSQIQPLFDRVKALEERQPERGEKGEDGKDGRDGCDGKSIDPAAVEQAIKAAVGEAVAALPAPAAGKDADPELVRQLVAQAVEALPKAKDGRDGIDGVSVDAAAVEAMVKAQVDLLPKAVDGRDGKDADPAAVAALVDNAVAEHLAKAIAEIPKPADGRDGRDGRDGKDGTAGRDAAHIDPRPAIDVERSYPAGTWAKHAGGLWLARADTKGMDGWDCIVDGVAGVEIKAADDLRSFELQLTTSAGKVVGKAFSVPTTIHRDIWRPEGYEIAPGTFKAYQRGDQVTRDGSQWTLMADHEAGAPGTEGSGWKLSSKRGRDGRDGLKGEKGERGAEGRAGRDLTQRGLDGAKW